MNWYKLFLLLVAFVRAFCHSIRKWTQDSFWDKFVSDMRPRLILTFRYISGCMISSTIWICFIKDQLKKRKQWSQNLSFTKSSNLCLFCPSSSLWTTKSKFVASKVGIYWTVYYSFCFAMVELALSSHNQELMGWVSLCLSHSKQGGRKLFSSSWGRRIHQKCLLH